MSDIQIATPPQIRVSWSCTRCGHEGGWAQTKFPVDPLLGADGMWEAMVGELRKYLVRKHQARQGCIAIPDDFVIGRYRS